MNKGIDDNENAIILHDDDVYWATDDSILIQLNNRVLKYSQSDLASIPNKQIHSIFHTCIYNGLQVDSIQLSLSQLTPKTLIDHQFAFPMAVNIKGECVLLAVVGNINMNINNKSFPMAIVYTIPTSAVFPDMKSNYCFLIDFSRFKNKRSYYNLISVHRLYYSCAFIAEPHDSIVYVVQKKLKY